MKKTKKMQIASILGIIAIAAMIGFSLAACGDDGGSGTTDTVIDDTPTPGLAYTLINSDTEYEVSKGTVTDGAVVIPATYEGKPVTSIGNSAFNGYTSLTSVTILKYITLKPFLKETIQTGVYLTR